MARAAVSRARSGSREPIAIGTPVRASRSDRPKPSAPEAPITATGSVLFAGTRAEYRLQKMKPPGDAQPSPSAAADSRQASLPASVSIREVGPRDGFQNEPETISTAEKVELINALARTGLPRIEVTSFVRAEVIPQLADAEEVLSAVEIPSDVSVSVLIPNERGLERALALRGRARIDEVNVFLSASETHNRRNVNRSVEESLAGARAVLQGARESGPALRGGRVDRLRVSLRGSRPAAAGARDRGGTARRRRPGDRLRGHHRDGQPGAGARVSSGPPAPSSAREVELTAHFHNTRGAALANVLSALHAGVASFESSFGELGGCPVPPGSTGNLASEDLVSMLHEMDIHTGVDLAALLACSRRAQEILGRPLGSHTLVAGPVDWSGRPVRAH